MTFGEIVSSYNMFGNSAAKRHNYMTHHQETHLPDDKCTIHDKVACLRDSSKDPFKSTWSTSSRGLLTSRYGPARSRTPSPCMTRRQRSQPGTPRASTPNGLRRSGSRDPYLIKEPIESGRENYLVEHIGTGAFRDGLSQRVDGGRYNGSGLDTFAVDHVVGDTFAIGADGGRGRSFASTVPALASALAPSGNAGRSAGAIGDCPSPHEPPSRHAGFGSYAAGARPSEGMGAVGAGVPPLRTPPVQGRGSANDLGHQNPGSAYDSGFGGRGGPGGGLSHLGYPSEILGRVQPQADARAASFVRLNSFLFRTHVTSLVSALAEDGWLEMWEKERLCSQAREDSRAWAQAFFRAYMRFMEMEDVPAFVASLRSQIV